jgi:peptidoglycan/LPS O-acetylase OafA/YrhL
LALYRVKIRKESVSGSPLVQENTIPIRGICAVEIMIGHIGILLNDAGLFAFRKAGILPVGFFFMISGYGLMSALLNDDKYLYKSFLKKRLISIWIPVCTIAIAYLLVNAVMSSVSGIGLSWRIDVNWYIYEITVFYILFFILFRRFSKRSAILIMTGISVIFIFIAYIIKMDNPWYGSTLCFPLGLLIKFKEEAIYTYLKLHYKRNIVLLGFLLLISIAFYFLLNNNSFLGT